MSDRGKSIFKNGKLGILNELQSCYVVKLIIFFCGRGRLCCLVKGFIVIVSVQENSSLSSVLRLVAAKV